MYVYTWLWELWSRPKSSTLLVHTLTEVSVGNLNAAGPWRSLPLLTGGHTHNIAQNFHHFSTFPTNFLTLSIPLKKQSIKKIHHVEKIYLPVLQWFSIKWKTQVDEHDLWEGSKSRPWRAPILVWGTRSLATRPLPGSPEWTSCTPCQHQDALLCRPVKKSVNQDTVNKN